MFCSSLIREMLKLLRELRTTFTCDKYSVNKKTVSRYLCVIIMAACILKTSSLPITTEPESTSPWWCYPCQNQHRTRHSRAINVLLKNQFNIATTNYRNIVAPYVKHIRRKIGGVTKKQLSGNRWLPQPEFFKSLKKGNKNILPKLFYQLQVYSITIDRLSKMDIRSHDASFNLKRRTKIMDKVKYDLRLLLCEIQQEIAETKQKITNTATLNLTNEDIPESVNHLSEGLIKDFSILKSYLNFLRKCRAKLYGKKKKVKAS